MTWPLLQFVALPPAPTVARNALASKMVLVSFNIIYARLVLLDRLRRRLRSHIFLPFVSGFAQTSYVTFLSLGVAQETPPLPRGLKWTPGASRFAPCVSDAMRRLVQNSSPRGLGVAKFNLGRWTWKSLWIKPSTLTPGC